MNQPKIERGQWTGPAFPAKKDHQVRHPACKLNPISSKFQKNSSRNSQLKSPKCFIKISGSRYNGTFLLNIDNGLDDTIYHTMRDIEVALENQVDPMSKPRVSPKNCLSSVFRCFGTNELNAKVICNKKKKKETNPVECSLKATINKSDIGPLMTAVQSNSHYSSPETSNESVMRDVVDVFRSTIDQFRRGNSSSSEEPSTLDCQTHFSTETKGTSWKNPSSKDTKKVTFVKFSQEEVLVIQPPKPSNNSHELEVGIEVKPKVNAENVGQSIKLARDKVLIGMQDGKGLLQIADGKPKRTLQMVIEDGINGKPSMKLSLNEETQDLNTQKYVRTESPQASGNVRSFKGFGDGDNDINNIQRKTLKCYKSVESQVSWTHFRDAYKTCDNPVKFRSESTQYDNKTTIGKCFDRMCLCTEIAKTITSDASVGNVTNDSQVTCIEKPVFQKKFHGPQYPIYQQDRMPYLVHTLYEPRALNNDSSCLVSNDSSTEGNGEVGNGFKPHPKEEITAKQIKPTNSITFSSDQSSSSKCTKIFRSIGEISAKSSKPLGWKERTISTNFLEDFEKVLQNMCGSSYLYHNPENKPLNGPKHSSVTTNAENANSSMSFDQWTQTDDKIQCVQINSEHTKKYTGKNPMVQPRDGCPSVERTGTLYKSTGSQSIDESSFTSSTEEEQVSDSSDGIKPTLTSSKNIKKNKLDRLINGKAKSFVGQTIFAAIEEPTIDPDLFTSVKKAESFIYPACKDKSSVALHEGRNVSVVNIALLEGPTEKGPIDETLPESFPDPQIERWYHGKAHAVAPSSFPPIRIKSKSCQDLSMPHGIINISQESAKISTRTHRQQVKLRYPQLTATDPHRLSTLNVCGILNLSKGEIEANQPVDDSNPDRSLPYAIRKLLLPSSELKTFQDQLPSYFCDSMTRPEEYWDDETLHDIENDWIQKGTIESPSSTLIKSPFKRTFFAMKTATTVVSKRFSNLFRKLSFSYPNKKKQKKNMVITDSLVYVAIPLEKKRENFQLLTK